MSRTPLNILYIMSDDHSAEAISCYDSRLAPAFQTPNQDQIGREGLRLECFYSTNIDIAPTLLDYAGVDVPGTMQGESFRARLADPGISGRDAIYFRYWMHLGHHHQNPAHYGIRTERWKLICYYGLPLDASGTLPGETPGGWELYDMQNDRLELSNLYGQPEHNHVAEELKQRLTELKEQFGETNERYPSLQEKVAKMG